MNKTFEVELLDELLGAAEIFSGFDKLCGKDPEIREANAEFDRALEPVKLLGYRVLDAIQCANTTCANAYTKLGILYGMYIIGVLQNGLSNFQALGNLRLQRIYGKETEAAQECL